MKRYENIKLEQSPEGKQYRTTTIYPEAPTSESDYYVITVGGDRYDILADQFYGDHTLWWIIASANSSERASLFVKPGIQLRIPGDVDSIVNAFRELNK